MTSIHSIHGLTQSYPAVWKVSLPWAPSKNGYWRAVGGRQILSKRAREYRDQAAEVINRAGLAPLPKWKPLGVAMRFFPPSRRRIDIANYPNSILDTLEYIGMLEDDCVVDVLNLYRGHVRPRDGIVEVAVCVFE